MFRSRASAPVDAPLAPHPAATKQFIVLYDPASKLARFIVRFAAPRADLLGDCADVTIATGDGNVLHANRICAPSMLEWRLRDEQEIGTHTYKGKGPFVAAMLWGSERYEAAVGGGKPLQSPQQGAPVLTLFQARRDIADPYSVTIRVRAEGLAKNQQLRVDSGAGQVFWLDAGMAAAENALAAIYYKLGAFTIAADLVDENGFRIVTLGETSIEITDDEPEQNFAPPPSAQTMPAQLRSDPNVPLTLSTSEPWNLFRYARPNWAQTKTFRKPDGYASRTLPNGTFLAIRQEVATGGQLWYETGAYDWVPASAVTLVTPSDLRGVLLDGSTLPTGTPTTPPTTPTTPPTTPPTSPPANPPTNPPTNPVPPAPQPPTPQTTEKHGIVTGGVLNVRAKPGIVYNNAPVEVLRYGAKVVIHDEAIVAGVKWYRIGTNKWVHGGYIRIIAAEANRNTPAPATENPGLIIPVGSPMPTGEAMPAQRAVQMPIGWVVPEALVVRKAPGEEEEVIGNLTHNQVVQILEEVTVQDDLWYRIGRDQWVNSKWVGVARLKQRPSSIRKNERWVGICLKEQTIIAYEGDDPIFAALVATGVGNTPTVQGVFRTWWRLTSRRMTGPGYFLEEVTWTEYFYGGYALHTAYWHDVFGRPRSHGCVNLSPYDAWWVFQWSAAGGANSPTVYSYWA